MNTADNKNNDATIVDTPVIVVEKARTEEKPKSEAGLGRIVMFGTVPGILLGASGLAGAASVVSDDYDAVVDDFEQAVDSLLQSGYAPAMEAERGFAPETVEQVQVTVEQTYVTVEQVVAEEVLLEEEVVEPVAEPEVDALAVAQVSDDMSFGAAFASARSQVGSEGVFQWRGNYYSTYTKEEWDAMDGAQRSAYMQKYYDTDMTEGQNDVQEEEFEVVEASAEVEEMEVAAEQAESELPVEEEMVIESESAVNDDMIVYGKVNGIGTMAIDADGDGDVDYMAIDSDGSGELDDDEIYIIGDGDMTMDDLDFDDASC